MDFPDRQLVDITEILWEKDSATVREAKAEPDEERGIADAALVGEDA